MKPINRDALPYEAPLVEIRKFRFDRSFCASNYAATNEGYEDYETEYTLE